MPFIKLTKSVDGNPIYVNIEEILFVHVYDNTTIVRFRTNDLTDYVEVTEPIDTVMKMIEKLCE